MSSWGIHKQKCELWCQKQRSRGDKSLNAFKTKWLGDLKQSNMHTHTHIYRLLCINFMVIRAKNLWYTHRKEKGIQTEHKNSHQIKREESKEGERNRKELEKQSQNNLCQ